MGFQGPYVAKEWHEHKQKGNNSLIKKLKDVMT
jgi:hypothetical protein